MRPLPLATSGLLLCGLVAACSSNDSSTPAAELAFAGQPTSTLAGSSFSPAVTVEVRDLNGAIVTGSNASVSIHILPGPTSGNLIGTTTRSAVSGVATFSDLGLDAAGSYSLVATSSGLDSAVSRSFLIDRPSTDRWVDVGTAGGALQFKSETNGSINPAVDTIAAGDMIIWYWLGSGHSVAPGGPPGVDSSAVLITSATFSIRFRVAGTYQYVCGVHPNDMSGRVVVR
jgi:plastocyanin